MNRILIWQHRIFERFLLATLLCVQIGVLAALAVPIVPSQVDGVPCGRLNAGCAMASNLNSTYSQFGVQVSRFFQ